MRAGLKVNLRLGRYTGGKDGVSLTVQDAASRTVIVVDVPLENVADLLTFRETTANVGGGQGDTFYSCSSCGEKRVVHADGSQRVLEEHEDFC